MYQTGFLQDYANPDSTNYKEMLEEIRKELNFYIPEISSSG